MKKLIVYLLLFGCLAGVVYLGFVIFSAKNIQSVELDGQIQTVYFVDDKIDFEDAKLKVTYKSGSIKMLDLNSSGMKINNFSTSTIDNKDRHSKMSILYKSFTINIDYVVINRGSYYISAEERMTYENDRAQGMPLKYTYTQQTTPHVFEFCDEGKLKYFTKLSNGSWILDDGRYDENFNYEIVKDKIVVNTGKDKKIEFEAKYDEKSGQIFVSSVLKNTSVSGEFVDSIYTTSYTWFKTRDNIGLQDRPVVDYTFDYSNLSSSEKSSKCVAFKINDTIETSGKNIYAKVTIANGKEKGDMIYEYYVRLTDSMFGGIIITDKPSGAKTDYLEYCGKTFDFTYRVTAEN